MRSGFWFISKTDRIFSSGFMLYSFTSAKQMKRFLGCLWDEPKPKPKAVFLCISVCYLLAYLCSVGKPRVSEDLGYSVTGNTSTASLGLFTDSSCLWRICWKKYEISTLVSCMWHVKLWIKVPKLCISHWCVNLVKARGEQLIFVTDRYSISTCVCLAWLHSLSIVIASKIHAQKDSELLIRVCLSWRNGSNSFFFQLLLKK